MKGLPMIVVAEEESGPTLVESAGSAVSWSAILAGGSASAALTLLLLAMGTGLGFSVVSPWSGSGVSASSFGLGAGLYLIVVAMLASSVGGYLAGRLRTKWAGAKTDEVYFRDTAHGFLSWAFATLLGIGVLGAAAAHMASGAFTGLTLAAGVATAQTTVAMDRTVDRLLRASPTVAGPASGANGPASGANLRGADDLRGELGRLLSGGLSTTGALPADDFTYAAQIVASRTGLSQTQAERRVTETISDAKAAIDDARRMARNLALWLTASLLIGAFSASLAATEGGGLRDGTWLTSRDRLV